MPEFPRKELMLPLRSRKNQYYFVIGKKLRCWFFHKKSEQLFSEHFTSLSNIQLLSFYNNIQL